METEPKMKTLVFYSYKGGAGRSLLLANYARYLSLCGKRVFILDCDLEAPGLHHKFATWGLYGLNKSFSEWAESGQPLLGLVDYIPKRKKDDSKELALSFVVPETLGDYVTKLELGEPGTVFFMPAGKAPTAQYAKSVLSIEWKELFPPWDPDQPKPAMGVPFFGDLKERIKEEYRPDFLLIDSRTGITDIGSVVVRLLADSFVCFFLHNPENIEGTKSVIQSLRENESGQGTQQPEIVPVFSRVPEASHTQEKKWLDQVRSEMGDAIEDLPLYVLHEEPDLRIVEELRFGSTRALRDSVLLRDYFRVFIALDEKTAEESKYISLRSYILNDDQPASARQSDAGRFVIRVLDEIKKRDQKFLLHAGKYPGKIDKARYTDVGYGYVTGAPYEQLVSAIVKNLLPRVVDKVEGMQAEEEPVPEKDINWDLLGIQIGRKLDFCSEPYYLTRYRSLFLDVVQLGWVKTFTCFIMKASPIYKAIVDSDHSHNSSIATAIDNAKAAFPGIELCLMGESAAADVAAKAISPIVSGTTLTFKRDAEQLWGWMTEDPNKIGSRIIVCDHSVARKLGALADGSKEFIYSTNSEGNVGLVFNCEEDIPTGFLYPAGDCDWRYLINRAVADSVSRETWGDKVQTNSVAGNLWASGIEPLSWEELKTQLVLGMNPDDAETWLGLVDEKMKSPERSKENES